MSTLLEVGYQDTLWVNKLSEKYISEILNRYFSINPLHFGPFDGKVGIAMLASHYDKCARTNYSSKIIDDFNFYLPEFVNSSYSSNGFKNGKSGVLCGMLRCINEYNTKIGTASQINDLLNQLLGTLKLQRKGISSQDKETSHIRPVGGLGEGNAGYLLTYAITYCYSGIKVFKRLTYQLHTYQRSLWVSKINNWADCRKNIEDVETHYLHLKKFGEGKLNFFRVPKDDISFWHGTLGITNTYLSLYEIFKDERFLKEANKGLDKLLKSQKRQVEEVELLKLFARANSIASNNAYQQKKNMLFKKVLEGGKLSFLLASYVLRENYQRTEVESNFFFSSVKKSSSRPSKQNVALLDPTAQLERVLIRNIFPKSLAVWSLVYQRDAGEFPLPDQEDLSAKSLKRIFKDYYKQEIRKQSNPTIRSLLKEIIFNESKYVSLADKNINTAMLRAKELFTIHTACKILSMSGEQFLSQRIKTNSDISFIETNFDWSEVSVDTIYNLSTTKEQYFLLLNTAGGIREIPTTANELLILHYFSSSTKIRTGILSYIRELEVEELDESYQAIHDNIIKTIRKLICNHCLLLHL